MWFKFFVDVSVVFIFIFILLVIMFLFVYFDMFVVLSLLISNLLLFSILLILERSKSLVLRSLVIIVVVWLVFIFNNLFCGFELIELIIGRVDCVNMFFRNDVFVVDGMFIVLYWLVSGLYIIILLFNNDKLIGVKFEVKVVVYSCLLVEFVRVL